MVEGGLPGTIVVENNSSLDLNEDNLLLGSVGVRMTLVLSD